jgi:hypothetical protein
MKQGTEMDSVSAADFIRIAGFLSQRAMTVYRPTTILSKTPSRPTGFPVGAVLLFAPPIRHWAVTLRRRDIEIPESLAQDWVNSHEIHLVMPYPQSLVAECFRELHNTAPRLSAGDQVRYQPENDCLTNVAFFPSMITSPCTNPYDMQEQETMGLVSSRTYTIEIPNVIAGAHLLRESRWVVSSEVLTPV